MSEIKIYTVKELSALFETSPRTINHLINQGKIKYLKIGNKRIVTEEALKEFLLTNQHFHDPEEDGEETEL